MSVFDLNGDSVQRIYSVEGSGIASAYDIDGNNVFAGSWEEEITVTKSRAYDTNYYVISIPQTRSDGTKQYPFVRVPNDKYQQQYGRTSALNLARDEGWYLTINAGLGYGRDLPIDGIAIQNNVLKHDSPTEQHIGSIPLIIDSDGELSNTSVNPDGATLVSQGIVSCILGFCPIIIDYEPATLPDVQGNNFTSNSQRQIIGQRANGDYVIITCEGRGYDNSTGWTLAKAQTICQNIGLKYAYNCDGGGSTETVIGTEQLNTIYETWEYEWGTVYGRLVPSFIVFNGTDSFWIPSEQ